MKINEILCYTRQNGETTLAEMCGKADIVIHLAGVNRPQDPGEFHNGNTELTIRLLELLRSRPDPCPVIFSSSIQASLEGRFRDSLYGHSKRDAEQALFQYAKDTGAEVVAYRFPNLFGKWCRPNYNSVVATFCHNIANDLPIRIDDPDTELDLGYIDDVVEELICAICGKAHRAGEWGMLPITYHERLGHIAELLYSFHDQPRTLLLPDIPEGSFAKKLYSTYLSYLPKEKAAFPLTMHSDWRGSFTELLKSRSAGQISVNISKPGITKGEHWHHTKWEFFIVVSGHGLIRERRLGSDEILEYEVSGEKITAVHMLPGYTHSIVNLSDTEDLVTVMWTNECFDPQRPDTYAEPV